jgi:SAM-dependent methyltransferase
MDMVLADFDAGKVGRDAHLGHWDDPSARPGSVADICRAQRRLTEVVADLLQVAPGHTVLDVGCGLGGTVEHLAGRVEGLHLVGLNIDERQLDRCRSVAPGTSTTSWIRGDAEALPVADATVDRLVCIEAMPHFGSRAGFLAEAARVLRDDGLLVVTDLLVDPAAPATLGVRHADLAAQLDRQLGPWPEPDASLAGIVAAAEAVGLRCTTSVDATAATFPSHALSFRDHGEEDARRFGEVIAAERLFSELHAASLLTCHYLAFARRRRAA